MSLRRDTIDRLVDGEAHAGLCVVTRYDVEGRKLYGAVITAPSLGAALRGSSPAELWQCGPIHVAALRDRHLAVAHLRRCCALWIVDYLEIDPEARSETPAQSVALEQPATVAGASDARRTPPDPIKAPTEPVAVGEACDPNDALRQGVSPLPHVSPATHPDVDWMVAELTQLGRRVALLTQALVSIRTSRESCDPRTRDATGGACAKWGAR